MKTFRFPLRRLNYDVLDLRRTAREGAADETLRQIAENEQRILITTDKGFARRTLQPHPGLLIVTLRQPNRSKIHERVFLALSQFEPQQWQNLTVFMRDTVQATRYFQKP